MQSLILIDGPIVDMSLLLQGGGGQVFQGTKQVVRVMAHKHFNLTI